MSAIGDALLGIKRPDPEREAAQLVLDEFRHMLATQTQAMERFGAQIINHVLSVETVTFGTDGRILRDFGVPIGSIDVSNNSQDDVTVCSGDRGPVAPTIGVGVFVVPSGADKVVNIGSTTVSIYGTSGDTISYQALTTGGLAGPGLNAVNGGGA